MQCNIFFSHFNKCNSKVFYIFATVNLKFIEKYGIHRTESDE